PDLDRPLSGLGPAPSLAAFDAAAPRAREGGLRQASYARARARAQIPRPLYPSGRHRKSAPPGAGGGACDLSLAGLRPPEPPPADHPGGGRMHPPLSPPRPATGVSTHPALWVLGQPHTAGPTHAVSSAAAAPWGLVACRRSRDRRGRGRGGSAPQD